MSTATETRTEPTNEAIVSGRPTAPRRRSRRTSDTSFIGRLLANVFLWGYALVAIGPLLLMV
ncbi:carbohydrate ABC transporter permease, partial [Pseudomonas sp. BGM005]|nr:carbohydrate ABC transporter permease [Pseudomonas sp. BG5]